MNKVYINGKIFSSREDLFSPFTKFYDYLHYYNLDALFDVISMNNIIDSLEINAKSYIIDIVGKNYYDSFISTIEELNIPITYTEA